MKASSSNIEHPRSRIKKVRPFIVPIFLPHAGCPHRCVFCNQISITGAKRNPSAAIDFHEQVATFLKYNRKHRKPVQIAFYGGNFLGQDTAVVRTQLTAATTFVRNGHADSIRFSTRPDTIDGQRMDLIKDFPVGTIELGVQSMDDQVLLLAKRGHTRLDTINAVRALRQLDCEIGLQMMVGLPGDTSAKLLATGEQIVELKPDFVRIYPTVVLKGSPLAEWYQMGRYTPLDLQACVSEVKHLFLLFEKNDIRVVRMGLQASQELEVSSAILAGPYHPAFGHLVHCDIFLDKAASLLAAIDSLGDTTAIGVNPRNISRMRGLKNGNIAKLMKQFSLKSLAITPDPSIPDNRVRAYGKPRAADRNPSSEKNP